MKRIALGAMLLALLVAPVHAADDKKDGDNLLLKRWEQRQKDNVEVEKQYKKTLQATGGSQATPAANDPWANMRGSDPSKAKR